MPDHHVKGQPAAPTYVREKGCLKSHSNRETPCSKDPCQCVSRKKSSFTHTGLPGLVWVTLDFFRESIPRKEPTIRQALKSHISDSWHPGIMKIGGTSSVGLPLALQKVSSGFMELKYANGHSTALEA